MPAAVATPTVTKTWSNGAYNVVGTVAIGANPLEYVTGGIEFDLGISGVYASKLPIIVTFTSLAGYKFVYVPGATLAAGKVKIFSAGTTQLSAAAIPAGLSGDTIQFHAIWAGMV